MFNSFVEHIVCLSISVHVCACVCMNIKTDTNVYIKKFFFPIVTETTLKFRMTEKFATFLSITALKVVTCSFTDYLATVN